VRPMKKIDKQIEIVTSTIPALSSMSEESSKAIQESLAKSYKTVGVSIVDNEADLKALIEKNPDLVFLGMAYLPRKATATNSSPYIWIADELFRNHILYTGSGMDATVLVEDKLKAKKVIKKADLATAPFFMAYTGQFTSESQVPLPFPVFIKPPKLGHSVGVDKLSIAKTYREYKSKIAKLDKDLDSESLVEAYLTGREFTVAIVKDKPVANKVSTAENDEQPEEIEETYQVMPLELKAPENSNGDIIIGHKFKSSDVQTETEIVSDPDMKKALSELALDCFKALGAKDYARIDIRCDSEGNPQFIKADLIPGVMDDSSNFQKAYNLNSKISDKDMLLRIVELGFEGHETYVAPVIPEPSEEESK